MLGAQSSCLAHCSAFPAGALKGTNEVVGGTILFWSSGKLVLLVLLVSSKIFCLREFLEAHSLSNQH